MTIQDTIPGESHQNPGLTEPFLANHIRVKLV